MSDPLAAAGAFVLAYVSAGEELVSGRAPDDALFALAANDLIELTGGQPEGVAVAMLGLIDAAIDLVAEATGARRTDVARSIARIAEQRRAAT